MIPPGMGTGPATSPPPPVPGLNFRPTVEAQYIPPEPSLPRIKSITPHQMHVAKLAVEHPEWSSSDIAEQMGRPREEGRSIDRILSKPHVRMMLVNALDKAGATLEASAKVIAEAHEATETKVFHSEKDGVVYSEPLVDHRTRIKAADTAVEWRGIKDQPVNITKSNVMVLTDQQLALVARQEATVGDFIKPGGAA